MESSSSSLLSPPSCQCRLKSCKGSIQSPSCDQNENCIEEYCLDNIDDIINDINFEIIRNPRNRARSKRLSKSSDLMTISETTCGFRDSSSKNTTKWFGRSSNGHNDKAQDARQSNDHLDQDEQNCCCICHKSYKASDGVCNHREDSLNKAYAYDPGIEEFILDDNELSKSPFYRNSDGNSNYSWHESSCLRSSKKSVKSVSIIDTLSEIVSSNEERSFCGGGQTAKSVSHLKVRDVKNRNKKKVKQQFSNDKRLSSSLPLLNIADSPDEKRINDIDKTKAMSSGRGDWEGRPRAESQKKVQAPTKTAPNKKRESRKCGKMPKMTKRLSSFERSQTPDWLSQIFDVAKKGQLNELKQLLNGMDGMLIINLSDRHGNNLLHITCYYNHLDCLRWLLSVGPDSQQALFDENKSGLTPVIIAAKKGRLECVDWLVTNTISQEQLYLEDGSRPLLHHAAKYGQLKVVEWLTSFMTKNGHSIDVSDSNGLTPVHLAAKYGKISVLKFLVMNGADLREKDSRGYRCYDHAVQNGQIDCAEYIISLESSMDIVDDALTLENKFKCLRLENSDMKSCCKEALSLTKKLIKEREHMKQQFGAIHGGFFHLDKLLFQAHQENINREEEEEEEEEDVLLQNSGIKIEELRGVISNANSMVQNSLLNSSSDDHLKRMNSIEEKWRKVRMRSQTRLHMQTIKPIDVLKRQEAHLKLRSAPDKSGMALDSSSESALSGPESDPSEESGSEAQDGKLAEENLSPMMPVRKSSSKAKLKDYRKIPGSVAKYSGFTTGQMTTSVRQKPTESDFFIGAEGATCSVLEVLDPSSDEENSKSFLVHNNASITGQSGKICIASQNSTFHKSEQPKSQRSKNSLKINTNRVINSSHVKHLSKSSSYVVDTHQVDGRFQGTSLAKNNVERRHDRGAKSDGEELDGFDFDDIMVTNMLDNSRFSEPDLIKGTKDIAKLPDGSEQTSSCIDQLSLNANVDLQFPSTPSTSDCSVNTLGAMLDSSYSTSTPIKKKGFMLKFQTLKKRWPSRHKFAQNKKSQEITADDFKETYFRSAGDCKDEEDRVECEKLTALPRQRESLSSISSTSSKQEKTILMIEKKDPPTPGKMPQRPPLPEIPTIIPPPLFPGSHNPKNAKLEAQGELALQTDDPGLLQTLSRTSSQPQSFRLNDDFCPQIVKATAETVKAASAAASFPLHKSSSISTDLLSPDSLTAGRLSPAPSEISKTESALSPPSDVSKTESTRHLNQLEKIEEAKQANIAARIDNKQVDDEMLDDDNNSVLTLNSYDKTEDANQMVEKPKNNESNKDLKAKEMDGPKRVKIKVTEKPWYDVSDEEDMPSPTRYEMVATAAMCSSSEDERMIELASSA